MMNMDVSDVSLRVSRRSKLVRWVTRGTAVKGNKERYLP